MPAPSPFTYFLSPLKDFIIGIVWFVPLVYVLLLTIVWEFYEYFFVGIGDKENLLNRTVDVSVAFVGWLVVVLITMAATGASFPFIAPIKP